MKFGFEIAARDGDARRGRLATAHGTAETPAFDSSTAAQNGVGKGAKKMASYGTSFHKHAALPTMNDFRGVGTSALEGARQTGEKAKEFGRKAKEELGGVAESAGEGARQGLEYLKSHPTAAMLATGGAGLLGLKGLAGVGRRIAGGVARKAAPSLMQRIGRVDRIGQRRAVHAVHLVSAGTGEERVLSTLRERLARARADIGAPDVFGADAEQATARIVVTGETADTGELEDRPSSVDGLTVNLREEAADEARRLARARALTHEQDDKARLDGDGPWVMASRRRTTRQQMGGRALLVWRVTCDDECGRPVESRIVPVTVPLTGARGTWRGSARIGQRLRELDATVRPSVERAVDDWRRSVEANVGSFVSTRLRREEAMAGHSTPRAFQPGLFDRRADRLHETDRAAVADADRRRAGHLAALARATTLTSPPAQLLLVLVPW